MKEFNALNAQRQAFQIHFTDAENVPPVGEGATLEPKELAHRAIVAKTFYQAGVPLAKIKEYAHFLCFLSVVLLG